MIFANFFYFIIAITLFSTAPHSDKSILLLNRNVIWIVLIYFIFWYFNRHNFTKIRINYDNESIDSTQAKKEYHRLINFNTIISLFLFAIEIFIFDIKSLLIKIPILGNSEFFLNAGGLAFFFLHLVIIWYWAFRSVGIILKTAKSTGDFINANIKFNLVIVIPWLVLSMLLDIFVLFELSFMTDMMNSALFQVVFFGVFLLLFTLFAPVLITRLWDCEPLPENELKETIVQFSLSQGVRFKEVMSWNAMNKGLITAGVVGLLYPFRFLLITPGLMGLLEKDEILAVVSHEIGHVKKRHLFFYMVFFIGFVIFSLGTLDRLVKLFLNTKFGFEIMISADGGLNLSFLSMLSIFIMLFFFVGYFRFIFGYFMRNFERQADIFCFQTGIDPNFLISSFSKLGALLGENSNRSNWHHFNINQRINFIRQGIDNPELLKKHEKKIKRSLAIFIVVLILFSLVSFNPLANKLDNILDLNLMVSVIQQKIAKNPDNPELFSLLGMVYYELKEWIASKEAYEKSIKLKNDQPEALNNLAWLLIKCPDKQLQNPKKALKFAQDASRLKTEAYILDTLAEAYLANSMYKEAYIAAQNALKMARENLSYYKSQVKKMNDAYKHFGTTLNI